MKGIVASAFIVLNAAFILLLFGMVLAGIRRRGQKIDAGMWLFIVTIGVPAVLVLVGTLLGY